MRVLIGRCTCGARRAVCEGIWHVCRLRRQSLAALHQAPEIREGDHRENVRLYCVQGLKKVNPWRGDVGREMISTASPWSMAAPLSRRNEPAIANGPHHCRDSPGNDSPNSGFNSTMQHTELEGEYLNNGKASRSQELRAAGNEESDLIILKLLRGKPKLDVAWRQPSAGGGSQSVRAELASVSSQVHGISSKLLLLPHTEHISTPPFSLSNELLLSSSPSPFLSLIHSHPSINDYLVVAATRTGATPSILSSHTTFSPHQRWASTDPQPTHELGLGRSRKETDNRQRTMSSRTCLRPRACLNMTHPEIRRHPRPWS